MERKSVRSGGRSRACKFVLAMNSFRYRISLRLRHPNMDPETVSAALGMRPEFQWMAGQKRFTPKGQPLEGVNAFTYWCSEGIEGPGSDLRESLITQLCSIEARMPFFSHFVSTGGSIEFYIAWFTNGLNSGATLDRELLKRLVALSIDVGLDVYGGESP